MIDALKEIPVLISEIYDSAKNLGLKGCATALLNKTSSVAIEILTAGVYIVLLNQHSWLILLSFTAGIASPDYVIEKTNNILAAIFYTKELPHLSNTAKKTEKIWHNIKNFYNYVKPIAVAGFIGLMALPVLTTQLVAVFAGLRLGGHFGKMADTESFKTKFSYA